VLLLGGLSLYLNRGRLFKSAPMEIGDRSLQPRGWMLRLKKTPANPVLFLLNREFNLTSVRVVSTDALATNRYALAVWELKTESNSIPIKEFLYGMNIRGMHPPAKGAIAEPLQPGTRYRLFVEAGSFKAEHDFTPAARAP